MKTRKQNRIEALKIDGSEWCFDNVILRNHAVGYFSKLYKVDDNQIGDFPITWRFLRVGGELLETLSYKVSMEEVKHSMFSMTPLNSPGIYEFHAKFYQDIWDIVGESVFEMVKNLFRGGVLEPSLNRTLLVFIPKNIGAETINQFRPISLCTVLYKVTITLIVIRLCRAMQILVKQNQSSFITSRSISDNIVVA
ncbi:reverse transcriptase [Gossypium australe]|uniref:Reverse transcriptase n=1 Tax=Gossypium australe TaxID=47621 RepID=A0A5B6WUB6_9ROSI|nr:reverse transcriptase [Gossypium australe]